MILKMQLLLTKRDRKTMTCFDGQNPNGSVIANLIKPRKNRVLSHSPGVHPDRRADIRDKDRFCASNQNHKYPIRGRR
jgi:hypothetical protein